MISRREFILRTGLASGALAWGPLGFAQTAAARVALVVESGDAIASAEPVKLAMVELERVLTANGRMVERRGPSDTLATGVMPIVIAGNSSTLGSSALKAAGISLVNSPESLALGFYRRNGR